MIHKLAHKTSEQRQQHTVRLRRLCFHPIRISLSKRSVLFGCFERMECVICCAGIESVGNRCVVPCGHVYHVECLIPWILINANCPLCRATCSKDDIVLTNGREVKAVIYLDDLIPPQRCHHQIELGQRRANARYGYDEPERSDFVKTMAYILLPVITFILVMKAIGVYKF